MKAVGRTSVGTSPFCNSPGWLRQVSGVGVSVMLGRVGRGGTRVFVAVGGRDVAGNVPAFDGEQAQSPERSERVRRRSRDVAGNVST